MRALQSNAGDSLYDQAQPGNPDSTLDAVFSGGLESSLSNGGGSSGDTAATATAQQDDRDVLILEQERLRQELAQLERLGNADWP